MLKKLDGVNNELKEEILCPSSSMMVKYCAVGDTVI